jgi:hypothetical protein
MNNNSINLIQEYNNKKINDKCLIIGQLNLGDLFILNGAIRYYENIYENVILLCNRKHYKNILHMFNDSNIINIICSDEKILDNNYHIYNNYKDYDIIKFGSINDNWDSLKSSLLINNLPLSFFITYYSQIGIDYDIRYKFEKINRNFDNENIFYEKVMNSYADKYIFAHNCENFNDNFEINNPNNYPIFNPNINYYDYYRDSKYDKFWNGIISDNIFDYCKIIENSIEIHLTFSSFFNLCVFLDLSKVKEKYIYTKITNIKDMHQNLDSWKIIYY